MLMAILLSVALTSNAQAQATQPADARAQAEQLARSGSNRAALERFQALAAANPDDVEVRVWIARLHGRLGEHGRAIAVYESVIASNPQHLEALIGLGSSYVAMGQLRDAADALTRAESLSPENAGVLAAQGRLHAAQGRTTLALAYYRRALTLDAAAPGVQQEYDDLRAERAHRVEVGYMLEHFDTDIPDPQAGFGTVNAAVSDTFRVSGTVQHQRKFSISETRGGGGIEWTPRYNFTLYGGALVGDDALILPGVDGYGGIAYRYGRATWSFDVRVADFDQLSVNVIGGGWRFALASQSAVWVKYYRFETDYESARSDVVQSWVIGGVGRVTPVWSLGAEYTRGPDQLEMLTIDRTGEFEANTLSVMTDFRLTPMLSLDGRYDYQARPEVLDDEPRVHRATIRLVTRF